MKADLYVQGHFWATIDIPGDSLLALLAQGMITEATAKALQLHTELDGIDGVQCDISLRIKETVAYHTHTEPQPTPSLKENTHAN